MRFTSACVHSLLAPIVITARLSSVTPDDHNKEHKQQQILLASSSFSKLNLADRVAIRHEVRHEPNKIHNIHDVEDNVMDNVMDNKKKKDNPTPGTTDFDPDPVGREKCVPPITVSEISKFDGGYIPLSSCSSSKKQICISSTNTINMKKDYASIDKKNTGVCTDINDVPTANWGRSDPNASSEIPGSYFEDTILLVSSATVHTTATKPVLEDYLSKTSIVDDTSAHAPSLADDSYNPIYDAGEPSAVIEDEDYSHLHYYYDYNDQQEGDHDQQYDYSIHQYDVGMSFLNEKLNSKEEVEHYNDHHYQQQQLDERHLQSPDCATTCTGTRPDVSVFSGSVRYMVTDCIDNNNCYNVSINCWNTAGITDMSGAFDQPNFNEPLECWDTSAVTRMDLMFAYAYAFNQPIDSWDVSQVNDVSHMFAYARAFNQPIDTWDTSAVTLMRRMFSKARAFNQPIDIWDTSAVTVMAGMFYKARSFNQPIDSWDVGQVNFMNYMFRDAKTFNQCLSTWAEKTSASVDTHIMLIGTDCPNGNLSLPDANEGPWCQDFEQSCFAPGFEPSQVPSKSGAPSHAPTHAPSNDPSHAPSNDPSNVPSSAPMNTPTKKSQKKKNSKKTSKQIKKKAKKNTI